MAGDTAISGPATDGHSMEADLSAITCAKLINPRTMAGDERKMAGVIVTGGHQKASP